jgi:hypothetical protein
MSIDLTKGGSAPKLNVTLDKTTSITCDECGGQVFTEGLIIRKASKFLTGTSSFFLTKEIEVFN